MNPRLGDLDPLTVERIRPVDDPQQIVREQSLANDVSLPVVCFQRHGQIASENSAAIHDHDMVLCDDEGVVVEFEIHVAPDPVAAFFRGFQTIRYADTSVTIRTSDQYGTYQKVSHPRGTIW